MNKSRSSYKWMSFVAASLLAAALAGCNGGGGGGDDTAAAPTPPPSSSSTAIPAAAAVAANDTATNPTAAFTVVLNSGVSPVTVNSAPKVNFTVISDGAVKKDLTLSNVSFVIAKLVPGTGGTPDQWVNYIYRTETATAGKGPGGTPALATAKHPTSDTEAVGSLVYNDAGYYTYTFSTDIKAATDPLDSTKLLWDATATHRVAIQLSYANAAGTTVRVNPYFDFTIDASGNAVAVTGTSPAHKVVDITSCNQCHEKLGLHGGGRVDTQFCVLCHNARNTDANSGNVLDLRKMAHKIHAGEHLKEWFGESYTIWGFGDSEHDYAEVRFPQDLRNCTKCHDNTKAAQADNWKNVPSRAACGACHAGIDFATGKGATIGNAEADVAASNPVGTTKTGHVGGAKADDSLCVLCHDKTTIPEYHKTTVASTHNPVVKDGVASFEYKIKSVTINASKQLVIAFQVLKNGTAVAFNTFAAGTEPITGYTGGPSFLAIYATGQDGVAAPTDWNSGHGALTLKDAWAGANGNSLSAPDATNTYTVTIAATSASTRGTTTTPSYSLVLPADAKLVTGIMAGSFKDATVTERGGLLPGIPAMVAASGNTPDGKPNVARRVIFSETKCNNCHDRLGTAPNFHSGNYSIAMCADCHTPIQGGSTGWSASFRVWVHGIHGAEKRTVPFTWHSDYNFSTLGFPGVLKNCETCHLPGTYDFSASQYTAVDSAGKTIVDNMLYVQAATGKLSTTSADVPRNADGTAAYGLVVDGVTSYGTGWSIDKTTGTLVAKTAGAAGQDSNLVSSPIAAACTACHDDDAAISHIRTTGNGSFYSPRSTAIATKEQCLFCHGPGKLVPIKDAHAK